MSHVPVIPPAMSSDTPALPVLSTEGLCFTNVDLEHLQNFSHLNVDVFFTVDQDESCTILQNMVQTVSNILAYERITSEPDVELTRCLLVAM